jgi:hypothetical protein
MRHLAYAVKVLINDDLQSQGRRTARRSERGAPQPSGAKKSQPVARPAVAPQPASRTSDVPRPRHAANAGA